MGNNKELILVHHAMNRIFLTNSVNVMLTPEFYTLKKEVIPVKYAYQAKRIAPSLFDGLLQEGRAYDYLVWKEGKEWVFLAYDIALIADFLESKGVGLSQISKVFFAQQSLAHFDTALAVGEDKVLVAIDAVIVMLPRFLLSEEERPSLVFSNRFTPKKGVNLQSAYSSLLSLPHTIFLTVFFVLFAFVFAFEGYTLSHSGGEENTELEALYEKHSKLSSARIRNSILNKYKTIDKSERHKRDQVKLLSSMIFKGVTLTNLEIDKKKIKASFACETIKVSKRIKALAKKHHFSSRVVTGSHDLIIEGSL